MSSPDLIIHIGLAKCGSSTLQRSVFQHEQGYLGTAPGLDSDSNLAKQLQHCTPFGGRQTIDERGLARWVSRVQQLHAERWPHLDRVILSNEMLSSACRTNDRPVLKVLQLLNKGVWPGRVRVVVVLRSQATRIASHYAQSSASNPRANQADFERAVRTILTNGRQLRLLDYSIWIRGLHNILGSENTLPLFLEQTDSSGFWERLSKFCDLRTLDLNEPLQSASFVKNKRSEAGQQWSISPYDPKIRAKGQVGRWLNLTWPPDLATSARAKVEKRAWTALAAVYARSSARTDASRSASMIELTPGLLGYIQEYCGPFNKRLSEQLGQELDKLGYC